MTSLSSQRASATSSRPTPAHQQIATRIASQASSLPPAADAVPEKRWITILRYLDVVLVAVATPVALALGAPVFGLLAGAGGWLLQRALAVVDGRLIDRFAEPGSRLGLEFVDAFARIWLLAGAIVVAGAAGHRSDGLAAALVVCISYSLAFAVRIVRGRGQVGARR